MSPFIKKNSFELFHYEIASTKKQGLIVKEDNRYADISPLPNWSQESLNDAYEDLLNVLQNNQKPKFPSVEFGLHCLKKTLKPIKIPLCSLHTPKQGCKSLKLKIGDLSIKEALFLVKQYKDLYSLRLDFNQKWTLEKLEEFCSFFKPNDFEYLEEPLDDFEKLIKFSQKSKFPIAIDEFFRKNLWQNIPTLKAIVIKPTLSGTIPKMKIPIVLSSSYESSLGILHIATQAKSSICHGLDTFCPDFLTPPLHIKDGFLLWDGSSQFINEKKLCHIASVQ